MYSGRPLIPAYRNLFVLPWHQLKLGPFVFALLTSFRDPYPQGLYAALLFPINLMVLLFIRKIVSKFLGYNFERTCSEDSFVVFNLEDFGVSNSGPCFKYPSCSDRLLPRWFLDKA